MLKFLERIKHWHLIAYILLAYDLVTVILSYFLALWLRFDCRYTHIQHPYLEMYSSAIIPFALFTVVIYWLLGLYRSIWRFASFFELKRLIYATLITFAANVVVVTTLVYRMPISYYVFGIGFQFFFAVMIRFSYRFVLLLRTTQNVALQDEKKVLLIGAGAAGRMILRDVNFVEGGAQSNSKIVAIIDDNENKWGRYIDGVEVIGGRDKILKAVEEYGIEEIFIAIASLSPREKRNLINICQQTDCKIKQLPNMYAEKAGVISAGNLQNITIEDVLGRDPISLHQEDVAEQIQGKVVLVTGGGGSIGSELCRQIAKYQPKQLIIFDVYENNAYDIQLELKKKYPYLNLVTLIGSVRDARRIESVFETYRPNICYHAAAHKHVPLMEDSPCEAIKNNAVGTYKTAYAAMKFGCDRFVLISTDKAVNPTNVMGATKRICEMIIQTFDHMVSTHQEDKLPCLITHHVGEKEFQPGHVEAGSAHTEYVAVRFGNVLGSNGSVVPLFKKQIAEGGPVTLTHKDIIRYFMTIPEAVSLVLKAGANASGGEIFVLDMGEPVKILDLARNMIELAGLRPDIDIEIKEIGLRPGEKLYEEKLMSEEGLKETENHMIHVAEPIKFDSEEFIRQLHDLMGLAYANEAVETVQKIRETVVTFRG
ncbi:polysaccharide biosynthesis protein [Pseudobutyrivibrio xylanivorans]|uniref:NDP-sugar epimerase, includes UDP-GlcNAc-inverting 4,6-dehydratase FlaA1 and capsular polysaccharide biosynthesis protein EpsC n=1 Tax=Pseudobutyrivibrio xylanivorans DSM 14809 TaxID=1123012 RepID=A0A1M6JFT9_PSEXY|nr:nucleoside-diphosphate sugar epimerase/dehydratase [Pseudobutyrivibrio xylanivorans]SHJ45596.1 NDP-sugar epimerase, includes UDP-GlcNAc-inverting 4,6-dehydratase FlaA1 and capsular polysaccharide biosynthesis protein EpsC [Pseudobutyrivibrio xylanivorans DSM 14809]